MTELPDTMASGVEARLSGGRLTIDLAALAANYRTLAKLCAPAEAAAVVKADAYGIGIARAVPVLLAAGCRRFFVALPAEGLAVRRAAHGSDVEIYVLDGFFGREAAEDYAEAELIPVLNSDNDIAMWEAHGWDGDVPRPCAIHVDTGMNRLGLTLEQARAFAAENALTGALSPILVMSHLACGDEPLNAMNQHQLESFQKVRAIFSGTESSLANSAGIFRGADYHFELTRPGIALYGGAAVEGVDNPMRPVVTAQARILQIRRAAAGQFVGYAAAAKLARDSVVAIVAAGYADGYIRAGGAGGPSRGAQAQGAGFLHGREVPLLGRISMDLSAFDVTDVDPDLLVVGDYVELFGPNMPIDRVARSAGTISYELLTGLGRRFHRVYVGAKA